MGLNPIQAGLHRLKHDSAQPSKITLVIPPGDELEVSDEIAAQLHAASTHFRDPADVPVPGPQREKDANGVPIVEEVAEEPKPKKAATKKAATPKDAE